MSQKKFAIVVFDSCILSFQEVGDMVKHCTYVLSTSLPNKQTPRKATAPIQFVDVPGLKSSVGQKPEEDVGITLILSLTVLTLLLTSLLCCMEFSILAQKASSETRGS